MIFASPLWLLALVPWAGVTLWLLWGRRRQAGVPFLDLWLGPVEGKTPRHRVQPPPVALALAIAATLLALLACAGPMLRSAAPAPLRVIVDRGLSMSARAPSGVPRFVESARLMRRFRDEHFPGQPIDVRSIPTSDLKDVERMRRTMIDTGDLLRRAVSDALAAENGPLVVLSDRTIGIENERLVQIAPSEPLRNVGIVHLAARAAPTPQVMVCLNSRASVMPAVLRVRSAGHEIERAIESHEQRDYFVDLPAMGESIEVELVIGDDVEADNRAWVARRGSWPRIEPATPLAPELRRVFDVYSAQRPPGEGSRRIAVLGPTQAPPTREPSLIVAPASVSVEGELRVREHAVTRRVDWPTDQLAAAPAPPGGFAPLVSAGGQVLIAAAENPRRIWVGMESPNWPRSPAWVIFWTNVLEWLGEGTETFEHEPLTRVGEEWQALTPAPADVEGPWPGLYRRAGDGMLRAMNVLDVRSDESGAVNWRDRLGEGVRVAERGGRPIGGALLLAAVGCMALSAATWRTRALTGFGVRRTV